MIGTDKVIYNENEVEKAPFIKRAIAYIIDSLIFFLLFLTGIIIFAATTNGAENVGEVALGVSLILPMLYMVFKDFIFKGASIGKKLMRIKVIDDRTLDCPVVIKLVARTAFAFDCISNSVAYYFFKKTWSELITSTTVISLPKRR